MGKYPYLQTQEARANFSQYGCPNGRECDYGNCDWADIHSGPRTRLMIDVPEILETLKPLSKEQIINFFQSKIDKWKEEYNEATEGLF